MEYRVGLLAAYFNFTFSSKVIPQIPREAILQMKENWDALSRAVPDISYAIWFRERQQKWLMFWRPSGRISLISLWLQPRFLLGNLIPFSSILLGFPAAWKAIRNSVSGPPGSQEMTQSQWYADKCHSLLYGKKTNKQKKPKAHTVSISPFLWCKYSHHGWFQATRGLTTGLQKS